MANSVLFEVEARLQQVRAAVQSELATGSALHLGGQTYTAAQIEAKLDSWLALFAAAATARAQWAAAVAELREALPGEHAFVRDLLQAVTLLFGQGSPALAVFGIRPPKARKSLTPGQRAISVAKAKATRKLRGTLSKKQRLQIAPATSPAQLLLGRDGELLASSPEGLATEPGAPLAKS